MASPLLVRIAVLARIALRVRLELKLVEARSIQRSGPPLGVIGIIYESRPNVTADAGGLCLKSGNAAILRGGSESCIPAGPSSIACMKMPP